MRRAFSCSLGTDTPVQGATQGTDDKGPQSRRCWGARDCLVLNCLSKQRAKQGAGSLLPLLYPQHPEQCPLARNGLTEHPRKTPFYPPDRTIALKTLASLSHRAQAGHLLSISRLSFERPAQDIQRPRRHPSNTGLRQDSNQARKWTVPSAPPGQVRAQAGPGHVWVMGGALRSSWPSQSPGRARPHDIPI